MFPVSLLVLITARILPEDIFLEKRETKPLCEGYRADLEGKSLTYVHSKDIKKEALPQLISTVKLKRLAVLGLASQL